MAKGIVNAVELTSGGYQVTTINGVKYLTLALCKLGAMIDFEIEDAPAGWLLPFAAIAKPSLADVRLTAEQTAQLIKERKLTVDAGAGFVTVRLDSSFVPFTNEQCRLIELERRLSQNWDELPIQVCEAWEMFENAVPDGRFRDALREGDIEAEREAVQVEADREADEQEQREHDARTDDDLKL